MTLIGKEVVNIWKLFIKSPNNKLNVGQQRDKYIPNSSLTNKESLQAFNTLGILIGICKNVFELIDLNLSIIVWKYLINEPINWSDIALIDQSAVNVIKYIEDAKDEDLEGFDQGFVCPLSDGSEKVLIPNGELVKVTRENRALYAKLFKECRCNEFNLQLSELKAGFRKIVNTNRLVYHSANSIDEKLTGSSNVNLCFFENKID